MDVKYAFLNGDLEEEVYIEQPEGLILGNDAKLVCKLRKALYGLKQAPRASYYCLDKYLHQQGFSKGSADINLYTKMDIDKLLIIVVYVDDIIFHSNEESMSQNFSSVMQQEFEMSLLGCNLGSNDESTAIHQLTYRSMIGSLLYLTGTRSDIIHAVGIVGRFQVNPNETRLQEVKRIFKYLQGTQKFGLWLVSWFNKKQSSIALSTTEAKYLDVASCCTQLLWMMKTVQDIQITCTTPISILCDNTSAISVSKNPIMHSKTKHIPIKYHFLREQVLEQKVKLEYVPSKEQVADIFTKPLPRETFKYLRQKLGVVDTLSYC
eukprot:PITA_23696